MTFGASYTVNSNGEFELARLVPRRYQLTARDEHSIIHQTQAIELHAGETISNVVFVFPDPVYLPLIAKQ